MNVYFKSDKLGKKLIGFNLSSMLHFVFNQKHGVLILINYDVIKGEYVLQIPFHPGFQKLEDFSHKFCQSVIYDILSQDQVNVDISIQSVNKWTMRNVYADKFIDTSKRVFIIGDSSHQYPPSGGFGLNHGVIDMYGLVWRIANADKSSATEVDSFAGYTQERASVSQFISKCAGRNYSKFLETCNVVNLNPTHANIIKSGIEGILGSHEAKASIFSFISSVGFKLSSLFQNKLIAHLKVRSNFISLVHPFVDYRINYHAFNSEDLSKYSTKYAENTQVIEDLTLKTGLICPNFRLKNNTELKNLRLHISSLPLTSILVLTCIKSISELRNFLLDASAYISHCASLQIINSYPERITQLSFEELDSFQLKSSCKVIIIRRDHVVDLIL